MSRYGKIETGFWHSVKVRQLSEQGRYLMLYLLSCPHGNSVGCFVLPEGYAASDLGWSVETVTQTLSELFRKGLIDRDKGCFLTRILGWWGHNTIENPNVAKFAAKEIAALPNCKVRQDLIETMISEPTFSETVRQTLSERLPKPTRNQEPNLTLQEPNLTEPGIAKAMSSVAVAESKPKRASRLPSDWKPDDGDLSSARAEGLTTSDIAKIVPVFRDYWLAAAGQKGVKADWPATWRNWCRREAERLGRQKPLEGRTATNGTDWRSLVAHFKKISQWPSNLGPQPGFSGCRVPKDVLREFGYLLGDEPPLLSVVSA